MIGMKYLCHFLHDGYFFLNLFVGQKWPKVLQRANKSTTGGKSVSDFEKKSKQKEKSSLTCGGSGGGGGAASRLFHGTKRWRQIMELYSLWVGVIRLLLCRELEA